MHTTTASIAATLIAAAMLLGSCGRSTPVASSPVVLDAGAMADPAAAGSAAPQETVRDTTAQRVPRGKVTHEFVTEDQDLNGDGEPDTVVVSSEGGSYTVHVNDASAQGHLVGGSADGVDVVDLDRHDDANELRIWTYGPSDDFASDYYWYDGEEVRLVGEIEGWAWESGWSQVWSKQYCHSEGWEWEREYRLTREHTLEFVRQPLWYVGLEAATYADIPIYETPDCATVSFTVPAETTLLVVACDCITGTGGPESEWDQAAWRYLVRAPDGRVGWIHAHLPEKLVVPLAD